MSGPATSPTAQSAVMRPKRAYLIVSSVIFGIWGVALVCLAATDRPPVLLNRLLIQRSPLVVTAKVESLTEGRCQLLKSWRSIQPDEHFIVTNLNEVHAIEGETYLIPLDPTSHLADTTYKVTAIPERRIPPAIYPATPTTATQLETILTQSPHF